MELSGLMLITNRLDACADYYTALLGCDPERGAGWVHFALPGGRMLALHTPWSPDLPSEGGSTVALLRRLSLARGGEPAQGAGIELSEPHDIPAAGW